MHALRTFYCSLHSGNIIFCRDDSSSLVEERKNGFESTKISLGSGVSSICRKNIYIFIEAWASLLRKKLLLATVKEQINAVFDFG